MNGKLVTEIRLYFNALFQIVSKKFSVGKEARVQAVESVGYVLKYLSRLTSYLKNSVPRRGFE